MAQPLPQLVLGPTKLIALALAKQIMLTVNVVRAEVTSCLLPGPAWGLSSSVIRKTRFVAVLGALI